MPGLKGPARLNPPKTPLDAWKLLINCEIIEKIVMHTNERIEQMRVKYAKFKRSNNSRQTFGPSFVNPVDKLEIEAFIGLLYMQGVFKSGHEDIMSMWATDGTGRDLFRSTMSLARFSFILSCLRFDDHETRDERRKIDKLAAISSIFSQFVENCKANYSPGLFLTVDEMLVPFRGRCGFRMYIPNKPARYGLKVQILADAKTFYMYNAEVYVGKNEAQSRASDLLHPTQVVLRMTEPIFGSKRNVTGDNWYTSIELVRELRKRDITYVGTMKKIKGKFRQNFSPIEKDQ